MIISGGHEASSMAARIVAAGGIIGFRTDTFYGLGADPFNRDAVTRINLLKGREGKPILVIISDESVLSRLADSVSDRFLLIAKRHWPGPLTIVCRTSIAYADDLTAGTGTLGVRLPSDQAVRDLVRACGGVLTATSANPATFEPARTAREVEKYFGDQLGLIIDSGDSPATAPSTVLDIVSDPPRIVREGVLTRHALSQTFRELGLELA
jgi:L-threonylcarbamoyladenylate synthase